MAISKVDAEECNKIMASLPQKEGWMAPMLLFRNTWVLQPFFPDVLAVHRNFTPRAGDVVLVTMPKAGTTWIKGLAFAVVHRSRHNFSEHPLLTHNSHDLVPFIEFPLENAKIIGPVEDMQSPRVLATHLALPLLPESVTGSGNCKVVYLCRDLKDVLISIWQFYNKTMGDMAIELDKLFEFFCKGDVPFGPFWDQTLGYWKASQEMPDKVLFLQFEQMKADPAGNVRKLAEFLGYPFTEEEEKNGVVDQVVKLCSFETMKSVKGNEGTVGVGAFPAKKDSFFRNGKVGDWARYLTPEMAEKLDNIVNEKFKEAGLIL